MFFAAVIISILWAKLRGGDLGRLGQVDLKGTWLVFLAFGIQGLLSWGGSLGWAGVVPWIPILAFLSYALILAGLYLNRSYPGVWAMIAGAAGNFLVIMANGGRMPVSAAAMKVLGVDTSQAFRSPNFTHQIMTPETTLFWLADIIPVISPFSQKVIISLGDILIVYGIFRMIQAVTREQ